MFHQLLQGASKISRFPPSFHRLPEVEIVIATPGRLIDFLGSGEMPQGVEIHVVKTIILMVNTTNVDMGNGTIIHNNGYENVEIDVVLPFLMVYSTYW